MGKGHSNWDINVRNMASCTSKRNCKIFEYKTYLEIDNILSLQYEEDVLKLNAY